MTDDQKQRLRWARDMLLTARERLVEERSHQATHGRSVKEFYSDHYAMVDAVAFTTPMIVKIAKEMVEATGGITK
jgi:hypothetical protein